MNRNQNHGDDDASSSSTKKSKTCENAGLTPWANLNHDVLLLVMMQLGVVDFVSFSRVCKSWRSLALSSRNNFMVSRPPMPIYIFRHHSKKDYCYMQDFEGRKLETIFPCSAPMTFFGVTCGYLILFRKRCHDFLLVNPITGHQLHFPTFHFHTCVYPADVKAILVFSPSISRWVFVISYALTSKISFYITGKDGWNHVSSTLPILDLHAFKGKIYTLHTDCCLGELRLNPKPNLLLYETKNFPKPDFKYPKFVSSSENLYITSHSYVYQDENPNKLLELDFGEMKWVSPEKTIGKYAFFLSKLKNSAAIRRESWDWASPQTHYKIYDYFADKNCPPINKNAKSIFFSAKMWYFPHECLNVNLIDD